MVRYGSVKGGIDSDLIGGIIAPVVTVVDWLRKGYHCRLDIFCIFYSFQLHAWNCASKPWVFPEMDSVSVA